jgi:hypothetical protein
MDRSKRISEIAKHLERPYRSLIKVFMQLKTREAIQASMLETALSLPEAIQQKLPSITDKMALYTIGSKLWERKTGDVVTVVSVILNEEVPDFLTDDEKMGGLIFALLLDLNTEGHCHLLGWRWKVQISVR